jgi:SAM-dependent methyltransferase
MAGKHCPICEGSSVQEFIKEGCAYFRCRTCDFLFHRAEAGGPTRYDGDYWDGERVEALRREREDGFLRALELLYLSDIPVANLLDFGCGAGITVNMLRSELNLNAVGVDPFGEFTESPFLHRHGLKDLQSKYPRGYFDAIYSIEVFEHLEDPKQTMAELCHFLKPGGKLLINTGTQEFLAGHDPKGTYIDPLVRGHISIYSLQSFNSLGQAFRLQARFLGDRKYMVLLEPLNTEQLPPLPENLATLARLGAWAPLLFREYMRLILLEKEFSERTAWALSLNQELNALRSRKTRS